MSYRFCDFTNRKFVYKSLYVLMYIEIPIMFVCCFFALLNIREVAKAEVKPRMKLYLFLFKKK